MALDFFALATRMSATWRAVVWGLAASGMILPLPALADPETTPMTLEEPPAGYHLSISGATDAPRLRWLDPDAPRAQGEVTLGRTWRDEFCGLSLQATLAVEPEVSATGRRDGQALRPDGTQAWCHVGNWRWSLGWEERNWGPGEFRGESRASPLLRVESLLLGKNARPVPAMGVRRVEMKPSPWPVLKWLGPWQFEAFLGRMERDRQDVTHPLFFGARLVVQPRPWLTLGAARTAQFCGKQDGVSRSCNFGTFKDLLLGNDNPGIDATPESEPGNQMAGFDFRVVSPWRALPFALDGQLVGEDESHYWPTKLIAQFGAETFGEVRGAPWVARVEYVNTACSWTREAPRFGCAYRQGLFDTEGYRHRGRVMGHGLEHDADVWSAALATAIPGKGEWRLAAAKGRIVRGTADDEGFLSSAAADLQAVTLAWSGGQSPRWSAAAGWLDLQRDDGGIVDDGAYARLGVSWNW
jgi:Capsule assembly protein Wzi